MSILSGFFKTKKFRKTSDGYKLESLWTSSQTVEMNDGNTAETNLGAIKGITSSLASTSSNYALSASAGKSLQDQVSTLNTNLNAMHALSFGGTSAVVRSTKNTTSGECTYMQYGKVIVIRGSFKLASTCTGTYTNYGVFNNIPKTYGNLQCPVWTDGEGTTSWVYANDTDKELRIGIRGASMAGKQCYFSGVYFTSE